MEPYENDYAKEEDFALWQLHEIRHRLAEQHQSPHQINTIGQQVIKKYSLDHLKMVQLNTRSTPASVTRHLEASRIK